MATSLVFARVALACCAAMLCACAAEEAEQPVAAPITGCATVSSGAWWNADLDERFTTAVRLELAATPAVAPLDAVIGLADGSAGAFTELAAIVRFNPSGTIDVRAGGEYRADRVIAYSAGVTYRIRMTVDVAEHVYDVDVQHPDGATWQRIATRYPFRTEQAGATGLDTLAVKLDSASSAVQLCNWRSTADVPRCGLAAAGDGFVNTPAWSASRVLVTDVIATPSAGDLDAVHGVTLGNADAFGDLAANFRFAPNGVLDARDADRYRADQTLPYAAGEPQRVRIVADLASRTYSVHVWQAETPYELARNYRFRNTSIAELDTFASIVDSAHGSVDLCELTASAPEVLFMRPGVHSVVPLANDTAVMSDGTTTTYVGNSGEVVAIAPRGGELAVDAAGNVYVARVTGTSLVVDALSPSLVSRWSRTYPAPDGSRATALAVTATGDVTILLATDDGPVALRHIAADGTPRWSRSIAADAALPTATGFTLVHVSPGIRVESYAPTGALRWSRAWPFEVSVTAIAASSHGQLVIGGRYDSPVDFGGGTLDVDPGGEGGPQNSYVLALSPTGEHVFSQRIPDEHIAAIATANGRTVVAGHHYFGPIQSTRYTLDETGTIVAWGDGFAGLGWFGRTYRLALGDSGRVYWSYGPTWPDAFTEWPYLVVY